MWCGRELWVKQLVCIIDMHTFDVLTYAPSAYQMGPYGYEWRLSVGKKEVREEWKVVEFWLLRSIVEKDISILVESVLCYIYTIWLKVYIHKNLFYAIQFKSYLIFCWIRFSNLSHINIVFNKILYNKYQSFLKLLLKLDLYSNRIELLKSFYQ